MPDKVFAEVDAAVAEEPHPPHMYKLQRCIQPISKDMEAAYVDAGAAGADARNNNIPTAVFLLHREWAVCFPQHMQCPPPQAVEATCIAMPLREAYQDMPLTAACSRRSGPLTPISSNALQIGTHATRAASTSPTATQA